MRDAAESQCRRRLPYRHRGWSRGPRVGASSMVKGPTGEGNAMNRDLTGWLRSALIPGLLGLACWAPQASASSFCQMINTPDGRSEEHTSELPALMSI